MTRSAGASPAGWEASRVPIVLFVAFFAFGTLMCLLTIVLLAFPGTALDALWRANPEAHDQYLLARHFYARGSGDGFVRAVKALEKAVALDPNYAAAWSALSLAQFWASDQEPRDVS